MTVLLRNNESTALLRNAAGTALSRNRDEECDDPCASEEDLRLVLTSPFTVTITYFEERFDPSEPNPGELTREIRSTGDFTVPPGIYRFTHTGSDFELVCDEDIQVNVNLNFSDNGSLDNPDFEDLYFGSLSGGLLTGWRLNTNNPDPLAADSMRFMRFEVEASGEATDINGDSSTVIEFENVPVNVVLTLQQEDGTVGVPLIGPLFDSLPITLLPGAFSAARAIIGRNGVSVASWIEPEVTESTSGDIVTRRRTTSGTFDNGNGVISRNTAKCTQDPIVGTLTARRCSGGKVGGQTPPAEIPYESSDAPSDSHTHLRASISQPSEGVSPPVTVYLEVYYALTDIEWDGSLGSSSVNSRTFLTGPCPVGGDFSNGSADPVDNNPCSTYPPGHPSRPSWCDPTFPQ